MYGCRGYCTTDADRRLPSDPANRERHSAHRGRRRGTGGYTWSISAERGGGHRALPAVGESWSRQREGERLRERQKARDIALSLRGRRRCSSSASVASQRASATGREKALCSLQDVFLNAPSTAEKAGRGRQRHTECSVRDAFLNAPSAAEKAGRGRQRYREAERRRERAAPLARWGAASLSPRSLCSPCCAGPLVTSPSRRRGT